MVDITVRASLQAALQDPKWQERAIALLPELAIPIARVQDGQHLLSNGMISPACRTLLAALNANIPALTTILPDNADRLAQDWSTKAEARHKAAKVGRMRPSAAAKIKSAGKAAADEIAAMTKGEPAVEDFQRQWRLAVCGGCSALEKGSRPAFDRCMECGCFVRAKTTMRSQSCPIGKW